MTTDYIQGHSVLSEKHHFSRPASPLLASQCLCDGQVIAQIVTLSKRCDIWDTLRFYEDVNFAFFLHTIYIRSPIVFQKHNRLRFHIKRQHCSGGSSER